MEMYEQDRRVGEIKAEVMHENRIVVKIGSSTLSSAEGSHNLPFMIDIAHQIVELKRNGFDVAIVSSGAVALGKSKVADYDAVNLTHRQVASAFGQVTLMNMWETVFNVIQNEPYPIAQILLTDQSIGSVQGFLDALFFGKS